MKARALQRRTTRGLFIIESLRIADEKSRREGVIIEKILRLSETLPVEYIYIRTEQELSMALSRFRKSNFRYLHISCHGDHSFLALTLDQISYNDFAAELAPYLTARRLFISACAVVNDRFAEAIMATSKCQSIIGPPGTINFDDALLMWASFYHLAFRDDAAALKGSKIRWALRKCSYAFQIDFSYYRRKGVKWERADVEQR